MPIKLLVVLVLLCLNLANNLYNLSGELAGTADYVRIGLNIGAAGRAAARRRSGRGCWRRSPRCCPWSPAAS
jgi:hypothetical protein